jgi:hypothetical protein
VEYAALLDQSRSAQEGDGLRMRQLRQKNKELLQEMEGLRLQGRDSNLQLHLFELFSVWKMKKKLFYVKFYGFGIISSKFCHKSYQKFGHSDL